MNGCVVVEGSEIAAFVQEMYGSRSTTRRHQIEQIVEDFLVWHFKRKGPASVGALPDRGSNPSQGNPNMETNTTTAPKRQDALHRAKDVINDAQSLLHAAWMAIGALDRDDHAAEQDALRSVLNLAGERLSEAEIALERAQNGRASA